MPVARKLVIDTDPGIDDAMAILLAACHPGLDLVGLTTVFGNVPVDTATLNALTLTELAAMDIPVARGAARPLVQPPHPHADFVHGREGFGEARLPLPTRSADRREAATFIAETVAADPGEITLCAVGPLTNLAEALRLRPEIARETAGVVIMGGALWCPGNATPVAEANIWQDPHAAAEVLAASWPVTLIGLDVTERVICTPEHFDAIAASSPMTGGFLREAAAFYFAFHRETDGFYGCYMHDPTAVLAITDPQCFGFRETAVEVTLQGANAGQTLPVDTGRPLRVARAVDADAIRAAFLHHMTRGDACRQARLR